MAQVCQLGVTICVLWCVLFNDFNPSMLSRDQILSLRLLKSELDEMRPKSKLYYGKIPVVSRNSIRFQDDMLCWTAERSYSRLTTRNHSRYLVLCSATSQQPPRIDCTLNMCTEPDKYSKATRIRTADCGCGVVRLQCCRVV